jgi:hypothetical protein
MILSRSIKTANFLVQNRTREFSWGDWDCNLFIADLLDQWDAHTLPWRSQAIRGKYSTRYGAARFQYHYTPAPQWLEQNGFVLVEKHSNEFRNFDIVLEPRPRFWTTSLYFAGHNWSVVEGKGLDMVNIDPGHYQVGEYRG